MKFTTLYSLATFAGFANAAVIPEEILERGKSIVLAGAKATERPLLHAHAKQGWINDPNGLWYDEKDGVFHLYYQYNNADEVWGLPLSWGHMTSRDLMTWDHHDPAIMPERADSGAYSGCMVVDYNNTSGLFNDSVHPAQRAVAIWTYNIPGNEAQYLSYSTDAGYSFVEYGSILDINSDQFRDPKVIWHEESNKWIMTVTASHIYSIQIYSSSNLKNWTYESSFAYKGFLGYQYECSGLAKVPVTKAPNNNFTLTENAYHVSDSDETEYMWVMNLAINPGGPLGGSFNQYFIGDFDGKNFTAYSDQTRFLDFGKDFYAFQSFFNFPDKSGLFGIAWASNWQYSAYLPADTWRSSMTFVRKLTLQQYTPTRESIQLNLNSMPVVNYLPNKEKEDNNEYKKISGTKINRNNPISIKFSDNPTGTFEFSLTTVTNAHPVNKSHSADLFFCFRGSKDPSEYIRFGYNVQADTFFIDRGNTNVKFVHENPFFTDKLSVNVEPWEQPSTDIYVHQVYGVFDVNLLELFFNQGTKASTNIYLMSPGNRIGSVDVSTSIDDVFEISEFSIREFGIDSSNGAKKVKAL